jgi:hypothetical protein
VRRTLGRAVLQVKQRFINFLKSFAFRRSIHRAKKTAGQAGGKLNREALQGTDKHPNDGLGIPGRDPDPVN